MPISEQKAHIRARIAGRKRQDPRADVTALQRELKTLSLEEHIRAVFSTAPTPTRKQIKRLLALLPPGDTTNAP
ncbi:hypothetical protein ACWCQZ_34525 [Streptomyces sp. NPDC002285]